MVKLKKYAARITHFVLFLTLSTFLSCSQQKVAVSKIDGREIAVTNKNGASSSIADFITPYREHIDEDLNTVLAYAPQTLDKTGQWQTTIGNMFADAVVLKSNPVLMKRENKSIDICMLNYGGVRSIIPKGDVTTRTAFEIMPFENSVVVVAMKGEKLLDMIAYIIAEKKPHPLSGLTFTITKDDQPADIRVGGKPIDLNRTYYIATNDYLYNGGDNMTFFKESTALFDLDYKLRNVLIDYFKEVDTLPVLTEKRITAE